MAIVVLVPMLGVGLLAMAVFWPFGILWMITVVAMIIYHLVNLCSDRGIAGEVIDVDSSVAGDPAGPAPSVARPAAERLAELDDLSRRGLLSEEEHAAKRAEILKNI